jgi:Flp pilus assembly protein TadB
MTMNLIMATIIAAAAAAAIERKKRKKREERKMEMRRKKTIMQKTRRKTKLHLHHLSDGSNTWEAPTLEVVKSVASVTWW